MRMLRVHKMMQGEECEEYTGDEEYQLGMEAGILV